MTGIIRTLVRDKKTIENLNSPLTAEIAFLLFLALAIHAWPRAEMQGNSVSDNVLFGG